MNHGKSLRIFLRDGSVTGIRHAEVYNWTGQAIACPRKRLTELKEWYKELPGTQSTGVYLLFGRRDDEKTVYIGESENTLERIGEHLPDKGFWNEVVIFTNKDQNLTKAHVQYLEAKLVRRAERTKRYELANGDTPSPASLAPAERDPMDEFIENMRLVLGALGYRLLEPVGHSPKSEDQSSSVGSRDNEKPADSHLDTTFHFAPGEAEATGELTDEGFLIHADSTASKDEANSLKGRYIEARDDYLENGQLVEDGDVYRFAEDVLCNSSSYAAAVVSGSMRSGPQAWTDSDGNSLRDREEEVKRTLSTDDGSSGAEG